VASIDGLAVRQGTLTALSIVIPAAVVGELAPDESALRGLSTVVVLVGFAVGGRIAGQWALRTDATARLASGLATGAAAYAVVQVVGIILRLARSAPVSWLGIPVAMLLAASIGMAGAWSARAPQGANDAGHEDEDVGE